MKIIFTFDDGKKSQIAFWNKVQVPGTYFILPEATELKTNYGENANVDVCTWGEVRLLAKYNEIGFHGYSSRYETWGPERTEMSIQKCLQIFEFEIGKNPVSFSYTNMRMFQPAIINKHFLYIRDYFWRDIKKREKEKNEEGVRIENDEYILRWPGKEISEKIKPWQKKIFCMHPSLEPIHMLKRIKRTKEWGYEYCVLIFHEITEKEIFLGQMIGATYDCITFREIFEGGGHSDTEHSNLNKVAVAGSTPAVSTEKK